MRLVLKHVKRGIILVIGGTIILIGLAMLVLPGPGIAVLIVGLAILATEFVWAENLLSSAKGRIQNLKERRKQKSLP